jgi:hypothetical protein
MKIEFKTETCNGSFESWEVHQVIVDGKTVISQSENIEPEDTYFWRDLESPHNFASIIEAVVAATRRGEAVDIEHTFGDED